MSTEYADCNDTAIARALACLYARINAQLKCKTNAKEKMCRHLLLTAASKSAHAECASKTCNSAQVAWTLAGYSASK